MNREELKLRAGIAIELGKACRTDKLAHQSVDDILTLCEPYFRTATLDKKRESLSAYFDAMRKGDNHLGLGDIRLTMWQQDEIIDNLRGDR